MNDTNRTGGIPSADDNKKEPGLLMPWNVTQQEFVNPPDYIEQIKQAVNGAEVKALRDADGHRIVPLQPDFSPFPEEVQAVSRRLWDMNERHERMLNQARAIVTEELVRSYPDKDSAARVRMGTMKVCPSSHRRVIEFALREGIPVRPEIVADYPDLEELTRRGIRPWRTTPAAGTEERNEMLKNVAQAEDWVSSQTGHVKELKAKQAKCRSKEGKTYKDLQFQIEHIQGVIDYTIEQLGITNRYKAIMEEEDRIDSETDKRGPDSVSLQ